MALDSEGVSGSSQCRLQWSVFLPLYLQNVNGTAGTTTVKVTHYDVLEQTECVTKVYFNTLSPKQVMVECAWGCG